METLPNQNQNIVESPLSKLRTLMQSKLFLLGVGISLFIIVIFVSVSIFLILSQSRALAATIDGNITYTALKPDPGDLGEVQVKYRKYQSGDAYKVVYTSGLADNAKWVWNNAISGQPYELIADLTVDGKLVTTSEPLIVTAPATNQELDLRVTWHNLPESVVREQKTYIKGAIMVNGYIPSDSVLAVQAKSATDTSFKTVANITSVESENAWVWNDTIPLKDYVLRAVLTQGNNQLAIGETVIASGGDSDINFELNSSAVSPISPTTPTATPRATATSISGTVYINGPENNNSSLLMLWRLPGEKDYKVITRINNPVHNGQYWAWNNLTIGKQYEITAVLQVNEKNSASTQSQIQAVPSKNVNFTLNTGVFIPTPTGRFSVTACNGIGNNQYNAILTFPRESTAGNYWFQVGRSAGWSDVYNSKTQATSNNPQITVQIDGGRSYYAQYAYSLCANCSEDANFSNFSQSSAFSCGGGPAYTGYVCNQSSYSCQLTTDNNPPYPFNDSGLAQCQKDCRAPSVTPTFTPIPTPTLTPTPTPKISQCNESCGGSGYTCDYGLTCITSGLIGSGTCRNYQCPDDPTCSCSSQ